MSLGSYDTDSSALQKRISLQSEGGKNDLNSWILKNAEIEARNKVLDLGCGTGEQSLRISKTIGKDGKLYSLDISQESLDFLNENKKKYNLHHNIETVLSDFDNIPEYITNFKFDRVVSSYSLYYSKNPSILMETISKILSKDGIFFFCGPSNSNNQEVRDFIKSLDSNSIKAENKSVKIIDYFIEKHARNYFKKIESFSFDNPIIFKNAKNLYDWWSSHNLFEPHLKEKFLIKANNYFTKNKFFCNTKKVRGFKLQKK